MSVLNLVRDLEVAAPGHRCDMIGINAKIAMPHCAAPGLLPASE